MLVYCFSWRWGAGAPRSRHCPNAHCSRGVSPYPPAAPETAPYWQAFVAALRARGWEEGRNVDFHLRAAKGSEELYHRLAAELVALQPDLIVAVGSQATQATRQLTQTIPIVMIGTSDPIGAGFIDSLARPGGNITGLSNQLRDLEGKVFQILKELRPGLSRIALLCVRCGNARGSGTLVVQRQ